MTQESQPAPAAAADDITPAPRLVYIPELDGMRAIAFGCVFLVHTMARYFSGGFIGVDLFFVLSGYLITAILLREYESRRRISLARFYLRRAPRLMPALAVMLAAFLLFVLVRGLGHRGDQYIRDNAVAALVAALYLMNWVQAFSATPAGLLLHTWSLAVEEQFYLLWPLGLILLLRFFSRATAWKAVALLLAIVTAWQLVLVSDGASVDRVYFGFDTRLDTLLIGCLLALAPHAIAQPCLARLSLIPIFLLVIMSMTLSWTSRLLFPWGLTAIGICAAWIILAATVGQPQGVLRRFLRLPPLNYCGRISYGLYLWHYPIAIIAIARFGNRPFSQLKVVVTTAVLALLAASGSYYFIELPMLKMRRRFR